MTGSRQLFDVAGRLKVRAGTVRAPVMQLFTGGNAREIESVRRFTQHLRHPGVRHFALVANRLSNGSLYVMIGVLFWLLYGLTVAIVSAVAAMALGHVIYPLVKRRCCRRRPFHYDSTVPSLLEPLDEYSFPSGHMMSCVAVLTPLCVAAPATFPWLVMILLIVGWARLVAGHHYPSDLVGGGILGLMVASPIVALQFGYG